MSSKIWIRLGVISAGVVLACFLAVWLVFLGLRWYYCPAASAHGQAGTTCSWARRYASLPATASSSGASGAQLAGPAAATTSSCRI